MASSVAVGAGSGDVDGSGSGLSKTGMVGVGVGADVGIVVGVVVGVDVGIKVLIAGGWVQDGRSKSRINKMKRCPVRVCIIGSSL